MASIRIRIRVRVRVRVRVKVRVRVLSPGSDRAGCVSSSDV